MPAAGLEPARGCPQQILSLPRLPFRHAGIHQSSSLDNKIILPHNSNFDKSKLYIFCHKFKKFYLSRYRNHLFIISRSLQLHLNRNLVPFHLHICHTSHDQRHHGRQMSQIYIHDNRYILACSYFQNRLVRIQPHHLLPKAQRSSYKKAFHMLKPSCMLHLPHSTTDSEYVKIAGLQKPYDTVFFIFLHKISGMVITST